MKDTLIKSMLIVFAGNLLFSVENFLFQFIMARMFTIGEYGTFNSLLSIYVIIGVPVGTILLVSAKFTSEYTALENHGQLKYFLMKFFRNMLLLSLLLFALFMALTPLTKEYLHVDSYTPLIIIGISLLVIYLLPVNLGVLQGLQKFTALSMANIVNGLLKLLTGAALVYVGFGIGGALASFIVATVVVIGITSVPLVRQFRHYTSEPIDNGKSVLHFSYNTLIASVCFSFLLYSDIILVKHFFSAENAGLYSSAVILGRIVTFLPAALAMVIFPKVSEQHTLKNETHSLFFKGLWITFAVTLSAAIVIAAFPELLITIALGSKYVSSAPLLRLLAFALMPHAFIGLILKYNLARNSMSFIYSLVAACFIQWGLIYRFHEQLMDVVYVIGLTGLCVCLLNLIMIAVERRVVNHRPVEKTLKI